MIYEIIIIVILSFIQVFLLSLIDTYLPESKTDKDTLEDPNSLNNTTIPTDGL